MIYKLIEARRFTLNLYEEIKSNVNNSEFLRFTDDNLYSHLDNYYITTDDKDFISFYDIIFKRRRPKTLLEIKDIVKKNQNKPNDMRYYN